MQHPPKLAQWLLSIASRACNRTAVLGDFEEFYQEIYKEQGSIAAKWWYWRQALQSAPGFLKSQIYWKGTMLNNYLKIAFRNLLKSKFYSFINIIGLAVGMVVFLFISIYTRHELSFNKFHEKHEWIYEIQIGEKLSTVAPLAPLIQDHLPEVKTITRIDQSYGGGMSPVLITSEDGRFRKNKVKDFLFVDYNFFDLFSFPILHGNSARALEQPYSMVLTESMARKLFGEANAVGQSIHYIGDWINVPEMDMTVTAVIEDVPDNSSIRFNGLVSLATLYTFKPNGRPIDEDWGNWGYKTFVELNPENRVYFEEKLEALWRQACLAEWPEEEPPSIGLVPLVETPFYNNNRRQFIYLIQMIGVFVLIIALINFVNLSLARSSSRAREVGIRKVVGSTRRELIHQFLCESFLLSLLVTLLSFIILELAKPVFYSIVQQKIAFNWIQQPALILHVIIAILAISLVAGIYPAIVLASFKASKILKGELSRGRTRNKSRFVMVVLQFSISTALIFCTLVISNQIHFLRTKPLGFDQHNIIHCEQSKQINEKYDVFKNRLLQNPNIMAMTRSNTALGQELNISQTLEINGIKAHFRSTTVDPDFISTMGIELIEGRNFSWGIASDEYYALIVNETFVKTFNLKEPIGQEVKDYLGWGNPVILGVMKDFHNDSFHQTIEPSALWYANWNGTINIRISGQNIPQTLHAIQQVWDELSPNFPFDYVFLDQTYNDLYRSEDVLHRIFTSFASMAIFIACLGLLGLISYSARQRTKEIGIRKVMGASTQGIIGLVSRQYILWVLIANAIALPLAAWAMSGWLNHFAYRTTLKAAPFLWAGFGVLGMALFIVGWQAFGAALSNPVEALRHE